MDDHMVMKSMPEVFHVLVVSTKEQFIVHRHLLLEASYFAKFKFE